MTPATIQGGGTNLAEYRALLQVLGFATQKERSAAEVVRDAWIGGVVSSFSDQHGRTTSHMLLPSSKCVALMAPLIAEGFFSSSLSFTLDNLFSTPYQPLTETNGRDSFTLVIVLFPDCFLEVQLAGERLGASQQSEQSNNNSSLVHIVPEDAQGNSAAEFLNEASHTNSLSNSPLAQGQQPSLRTEPSPAHSNTRELGLGNSSNTIVNENYSLSYILALPPSSAAITVQPASVDLWELHRTRQHIALSYLSMINDTLRDVQVRELLLDKGKGGGGGGPTAKEGSASPTPNGIKAEMANVRAVGHMMEKLKALLLSCIGAAEIAYRPLSTAAVRGASHNEEPTPSSGPRVVDPRHVLLAQLAGEEFTKPVREWTFWGQSPEAGAAWYDGQLSRLHAEFAVKGLGSFDGFLRTLKADALQGCSRAVTRAPELLLYRGTDGHRGVSMELPSQVWHQPKVPHMPECLGEVFYFFPTSPLPLLFDATPSPIVTTLTRWAQRKLTDSQVKEESNLFFERGGAAAAGAWADLSPTTQRAVMDGFIKRKELLGSMLQLNPVLAARLLMWMEGKYGPVAIGVSPRDECEKDAERRSHAEREAVVTSILLSQPFSVPTGYFLRELVNRKALSIDTFVEWLSDTLTKLESKDPSVSLHGKTIITLIDYILVASPWELGGSLQERFTQVKKRS